MPHRAATAAAAAVETKWSDHYTTLCSTHHSFPSEDVCIEADPVLCDVESAVHQDVFLQGAGVVCKHSQLGLRAYILNRQPLHNMAGEEMEGRYNHLLSNLYS